MILEKFYKRMMELDFKESDDIKSTINLLSSVLNKLKSLDGHLDKSSDLDELCNIDFENKMKGKYSDFSIDWNNSECIKITEHTDAGRAKTVLIGNKSLSGVEVRTLFGLKSANFKCEIDGDKVKFSVIGYGHGVGMSQTGADALAKQGESYENIIKHYYTGVEINNL